MALLANKIAIVTGGASGIGRAVVRRFAEEGAKIAIFDVKAEAEEAAREVSGRAFLVDVSDAAAVERTVNEAADALGGLDVLVNNAGSSHVRPLHATRDEDWRRMIDVNLSGVFHATRSAVTRMLAGNGGVIVNNASGSGPRPTRGEGAYAAAKAGVIALTQSAALEYGPKIRVNCVSPGLIRTPMSEPLFSSPEILAPVVRATPLGRTGTSEEVADVILFLASDLSRYVTGQNLLVDGGVTLPQAGIDDMLRALLERGARKK